MGRARERSVSVLDPLGQEAAGETPVEKRGSRRSRLALVLGRNAKIDLLKQVPLFSQCSKKELVQLALVADEIDVDEGTVPTREGGRAP